MTLIMASVDRERENNQNSQNLVKLSLSLRERWDISNDTNGLSNRVRDRHIFEFKVCST